MEEHWGLGFPPEGNGEPWRVADRDGTGLHLLFRRDSRRLDCRRGGWRPGDPGRASREGRKEGKWGQGTGVVTNTGAPLWVPLVNCGSAFWAQTCCPSHPGP